LGDSFLVRVGAVLATIALSSAPAQNHVLVSGHVIDGATGKPLAGATVVSGPSAAVRTGIFGPATAFNTVRYSGPFQTQTDATGRFTFSNLPTGRLRLVVSATGYLNGFSSQVGPNDELAEPTLDVAADDRVIDLQITLWPAASVSGDVEDEAGDPIVGAEVELLRQRYVGGVAVWSLEPTGSIRTDDRGHYRFAGVRAGEFLVVSPAQNGVSSGPWITSQHPAVYFPQALDPSGATPVRLRPGDALESIDLRVATIPNALPVTVLGNVIAPPERVFGLTVRLVPAGLPDSMATYQTISTITNPSGTFRFANISSGQYRLLVCDFPPAANIPRFVNVNLSGFSTLGFPSPESHQPLEKLADSPTFWADVTVAIEPSMDDLQVPLQQGTRIRGHVTFDASGPPPAPELLPTAAVVAAPAFGLPFPLLPLSRIETDGSFASVGLPDGPYAVTAFLLGSALSGWMTTSVKVAGVERFGAPLNLGREELSDVMVTVSDKRTQISGKVRDARERLRAPVRVVLFPSDPNHWRYVLASPIPSPVRQIVVDRNGAFTSAVTPGDYLLAALTTIPDNWASPMFLHTLVPGATRVAIELGERKQIELPIQANANR
jgi:hypothetical protein